MADHSDPLTETMTRQRMISDQSARELAPLLTANQRALIGIMATAELYQLDLKNLLVGYADETRSTAVKEFTELLTPGSDPLNVAAGVQGLMPQPCSVALNSARANGSLDSFYRSWLAQTVDDRTTFVRHEDTHAAAFGRLGIRAAICLWFIAVILLYVIPEHQKMYEEFGLEANMTMKLFLSFSDLFARFILPVTFLCVVGFGVYVIGFRRSILRNYMQRWFPGRWRQLELPKSVLRRKLMAWDLLAFEGEDKPESELVNWGSFVTARELSAREAAIMKEADSMETKAWLLRNIADQQHEARKSRFAFAVNAIILLFQALLAIFIILATFTIFSMLIEMMRSVA